MHMRKDEIEDRIIRLEQELGTLKAAHREGVDAIISEIRQYQDSIISERVNSIRTQLEDGYERMIACLLVENAERNLSEAPREPCNRDHRTECDTFYLSRIRTVAHLPNPPETEMMDGYQEKDDDLLNSRDFLAKPPCSTCFGNYLREKKQLESALSGLSRYRVGMINENKNLFINDLPNEEVLTTVLEPLTHAKRFAMLKSLTTGSMTFKELSGLTDTKGGHLIYHVTILIDAGLVIKTDGGKRYSITDRGIHMMDHVKNMYSE